MVKYSFLELIDDSEFLSQVLDVGLLRFIVLGDLHSKVTLDFSQFGIRTFLGTYNHPDYAFSGEILLKDSSKSAVEKAFLELENWADLLCFLSGNPRLRVVIQKKGVTAELKLLHPVTEKTTKGLEKLFERQVIMPDKSPDQFRKALWWYRKACNSSEFSLFTAYSAYWNSLEILCDVSGGKVKQNVDIAAIQEYLREKLNEKGFKPGHVQYCFNTWINLSIPEQIEEKLIQQLGKDNGEKWSFYCFKVKPKEDQLYQIRNDINHGNIAENSSDNLRRVNVRGSLLAHLVRELICVGLGTKSKIELMGENVDGLVDDAIRNGGIYDVINLY